MPSLRHLDVSALRRFAPMDALLYGFTFDSAPGVLTLSIEIDPAFHKDAATELGLQGGGERVVDLVLEGVRSVSLKNAAASQEGMASDEPPHEYEIGVWQVRKGIVGGANSLVLRCHSGPQLRVEFRAARVQDSTRSAGTRHEYGAPLGPGVTIRTRSD